MALEKLQQQKTKWSPTHGYPVKQPSSESWQFCKRPKLIALLTIQQQTQLSQQFIFCKKPPRHLLSSASKRDASGG